MPLKRAIRQNDPNGRHHTFERHRDAYERGRRRPAAKSAPWPNESNQERHMSPQQEPYDDGIHRRRILEVLNAIMDAIKRDGRPTVESCRRHLLSMMPLSVVSDCQYAELDEQLRNVNHTCDEWQRTAPWDTLQASCLVEKMTYAVDVAIRRLQ